MFTDLPPPNPQVEVSLATRGMSKGIAQTDVPQLIAKGSVRLGIVQAGGQWKNVNSANGDGEASLFVALSRKIGTVQANAAVSYKFLTDRRSRGDSKSVELSAGLSRKFGPVTGRINAVYSPDDIGFARKSLFIEAGPAVQLPARFLGGGWTVSAAAGHRSRESGVDYTAFNAGIGKSVRMIQLDLRYYDTDRSGIGESYRERVVGSIKLAF